MARIHFLTLPPELFPELLLETLVPEWLEAPEDLSPEELVDLIDPLEPEVATDPWEVSLTRGPL
jgi:hypothetical protein